MAKEYTDVRDLTLEESRALGVYFGISDTLDFFVGRDPDSIHDEVIIRRLSEGDDVNEGESPDSIIEYGMVCTLLWLARLDRNRAGLLSDLYTEEELELPPNIHLVSDSLVSDHLTHLRRSETSLRNFRYHSDQLCTDLFRRAVADIEMQDFPIDNSLIDEMGADSLVSPKLAEKVIVVPILRAGLAMLQPALNALSKSRVGFFGFARNEETAEAEEYYAKLPPIEEDSVVILTDPMLATGGTLIQAIRKINSGPVKPKEIRAVCVVAAPEGIDAVNREFNNVQIFTAAVDSHLNNSKYIVPGLGDYGDRYFGTDQY